MPVQKSDFYVILQSTSGRYKILVFFSAKKKDYWKPWTQKPLASESSGGLIKNASSGPYSNFRLRMSKGWCQ